MSVKRSGVKGHAHMIAWGPLQSAVEVECRFEILERVEVPSFWKGSILE
jgi:hypothetical protein